MGHPVGISKYIMFSKNVVHPTTAQLFINKNIGIIAEKYIIIFNVLTKFKVIY